MEKTKKEKRRKKKKFQVKKQTKNIVFMKRIKNHENFLLSATVS